MTDLSAQLPAAQITARLADLAAQLPAALRDEDFDGDYAVVLTHLARTVEAITTGAGIIGDHAAQMAYPADTGPWEAVRDRLERRVVEALVDVSTVLEGAAEQAARGQRETTGSTPH
ncbi:hypothetical protein ACSNOI_03275 [Actinomadura kijaniata]|uniref:hypothetical protein n=1 Tax=Actinomadura kijaniata TaxID=46161 RepID=UPI003F19BA68